MQESRGVRSLFIAKSYPPVVGGMERFSYELAQALAAQGPSGVIANPKGPIAVPVFAPAASAIAVWRARRGQTDIVHLGDALLAPFGVAIRRLGNVPVTVTVHGLDVTRETPPGYQTVVASSITLLDHVIAVSSATRDFCMQRWPALEGRISVIPNGVETEAVDVQTPAVLPPAIRERLEGDQKVLLTVGRLIRRKGAAWFVRNVLPRVPGDVVYVIAGEGPDKEHVQQAIRESGQASRVLLLGRLERPVLMALYARADLFIMPNIVVPNDPEGFGLVALEATMHRTPVVAANLQGIPEAIRDGRNGFLVPAEDATAFATKVSELLALSSSERLSLGGQHRAYTIENLSWERAAASYRQCFAEVNAKYTARPTSSRASSQP